MNHVMPFPLWVLVMVAWLFGAGFGAAMLLQCTRKKDRRACSRCGADQFETVCMCCLQVQPEE